MSKEEIKEQFIQLTNKIIISQLEKLSHFTAKMIDENDSSLLRDILACHEAAICTIFNEGLHKVLSDHALNLVAKYFKEE